MKLKLVNVESVLLIAKFWKQVQLMGEAATGGVL